MNGRTSAQKTLFAAATSLTDPGERELFLEIVGQADPELRRRLAGLLELETAAERLFEPAGGGAEEVWTAENEDALDARIGRYRLIERLGEGGCGVVYLAEQQEPVRRTVALKIVRVGMDSEEMVRRFEQERQALAAMDHPNIARVLEAGETASGRPYFVMERVEGQPVTRYCDDRRLDLAARIRLFIPVCLAIQHAHQKGVIHCDIKPANVLVTEHDGEAVPKVIDFGISRGTGPERSGAAQAGALVGTPDYMSPEQVAGDGTDVDTRSDVYSLGALLHELLAALPSRDFGSAVGVEPEEVRRRIRETPEVAPSARIRACPLEKLVVIAAARSIAPAALAGRLEGDLDAIVGKAMARDRQNRYSTANGLAADLGRYLRHEPVDAAGSGRRYRLAKLIRRNQGIFAAGTLAVLALGAASGVSIWLFLREARARQEAETARANEVALRQRAQIGERIAHTAVLVSHGELLRANHELEGIAPNEIPASLESAEVFRAVGEWLLREGRREEASRRLAVVAQVIAEADPSHSDKISIHFVAAAAAVADTGDLEHYEQLRRMAARRFMGASHPFIADEVLKVCLIMPAPPDLLARLEPLVSVLKANLPWDREDRASDLMESWQMLSLAMAEFRNGRLPMAEEWARRCQRNPNRNPARSAAAGAILAMTLYRRGNHDDARAEFEAAGKAVDEWYSGPFRMGGSGDGFWFDWMIAHRLMEEARGEVGP